LIVLVRKKGGSELYMNRSLGQSTRRSIAKFLTLSQAAEFVRFWDWQISKANAADKLVQREP
jgi:hypothetical protein